MDSQDSFFEQHAILQSKLRCPVITLHSVERSALTEKLQDGFQRAITFVQAPAGFGKTTAIAQWFTQLDRPKGWLGLDELDNDFPKFITYVSALIEQGNTEVDVTSVFRDWSKISPSHTEQIVANFSNHLAQYPQRPVIVLDDFHWITDATLIHFIERLLKHICHQVHLVLISRTAPALNLHELMLADQVQFITTHELKFSAHEMRHFFSHYSDEAFRQLQPQLSDMAGWPAGLQLFRLARENKLPMSQEQAMLSDYIFEEIIRNMPEPLLTATLKAAVSRRFNRSLLTLLCPNSNVDMVLRELETRYAFISVTGTTDRWFRFHSLFRQALIDYYRRTDPTSYQATEQICADWWLKQACYSEAAEHLIQVGHEPVIAAFLLDHGWSFYRSGQYRLLQQCFAQLAPTTIASHPTLTLTHAWWLLIHEDPLQANRSIQMSETHSSLQACDQASYWAVKSAIAVIFDDFVAAENWAQKSLNSASSARPWERCHSFLAIAEARLNQCDFPGAEQALVAANQICQTERYTTLLIQVMYLHAEIHLARGDWPDAQTVLETALSYARERGLSRLFSIDHLQRTYARVLRLRGQTEQAIRVLNTTDISERPLGDYWQFPILIEQLTTHLFSNQASASTQADISKRILYLASTCDFSVKWQLSADRALILFWTQQQDRKSLRYLIQRYENMNFNTRRFNLNARFNLALAKLGCHDVDTARSLLQEVSEESTAVDYHELRIYCQVLINLARQNVNLDPQTSADKNTAALRLPLYRLFNDPECDVAPVPPSTENNALLTKTEQKVACLLKQGLQNKEVAEKLNIRLSTVRSHIKSINRKRRLSATH